MATFEESFLYPLVLLLIGAGLSGGLVTLLSHELEKRRKEREIEVEHNRKKLEIKVDIASKMSEAMAYQLSDIIILFGRKKKTLDDAEKDAVYESTKKWFIETKIISSKLESYYFSETGIRERWDEYCSFLLHFNSATRQYFYENPDENQLKFSLERVRLYFLHYKQINLTQDDWDRFKIERDFNESLWVKVLDLFRQRGDEIIKDVLKQEIKVL